MTTTNHSREFSFNRRIGAHSSLPAARSACVADGGQLLSTANAEDSRDALFPTASTFRILGKGDGACWVDGDGNEVDGVDVGDATFSEGGAPTLVVNGSGLAIQQVGEEEKLASICQQDMPAEGEKSQSDILHVFLSTVPNLLQAA